MPAQQLTDGSDGLPVLSQGSWSRDKLYFLFYFSALFNGGMKRRWPKRVYVDLFAGPGMCVDRTTGQECDGSPMQALRCTPSFTQFFFNDEDSLAVNALRSRQLRMFPSANVEYSNLDCNVAARNIRRDLPNGALTLLFVDPWTYDLRFDSLALLVDGASVDLIVTFHTGAIKRNAHRELEMVDKFLDDSTWRPRYWSAQGNPSNPPTLVLLDTFRGRLEDRLGYQYFGDPEIITNTRGVPMYYVCFASRHPRGLDFWQKSSARMRSGQRTMF